MTNNKVIILTALLSTTFANNTFCADATNPWGGERTLADRIKATQAPTRPAASPSSVAAALPPCSSEDHFDPRSEGKRTKRIIFDVATASRIQELLDKVQPKPHELHALRYADAERHYK